MNILKNTHNCKSNLTPEERIALNNLSSREDIVIHKADKGGKIVIMDRDTYISSCEQHLASGHFYEKLTSNPNGDYADTIKNEIDDMHKNKFISNNEYKFLTAYLKFPRTPIFYGLPKIHKLFKNFPPLRPIVSGYNSLYFTVV